MSTSADALLALNALLSVSTGSIPANETASGSADNLTSLLDTLANFSARVNSGNEDGVQPSSNVDIASYFLAGLSNANPEPEPEPTDYDRYERAREQKFRDLETKFSFLGQRRMKTEPTETSQPRMEQKTSSNVPSSSPRIPTDREKLAAAGKAFANSAMAELLSGLQKSHAEKTAVVSSSSKAPKTSAHTSKHPAPKRRSRSRSSSRSSSESRSRSESSYSSSSYSSRSEKARKKKTERKKKAKKGKMKKDKQKNGKMSGSKQAKSKKNLLGAERKAHSALVVKLKANLIDYDKRNRTLEEELSRLKKQHNEMCRKLQRQKSDPRKDTLIIENEKLQADIEKHLDMLIKQQEDDEKILASEEKRLDKLTKQAKISKKDAMSEESPEKLSMEKESLAKKPKEENFEYFDPGSHWCKLCNIMLGNVFEWLEHLHSPKHKSNMDALDRPWMPLEMRAPIKKDNVTALKPFKGAEFLVPSTAFYCDLCKEFSGDAPSAEAHLKSSNHNWKYQAYVETNPFYERREMLEKAAAVSHRVEKSASSTDNKKSNRPSTESGKPSYAPEAQRVPHKPNESGKIKPFQVTSSSTSADKDERKSSGLGFVMKVADSKKPTSSSSASTLKKPHSAFSTSKDIPKRDSSDYGKKSKTTTDSRSYGEKRESSSHYSSDRKRHRDR